MCSSKLFLFSALSDKDLDRIVSVKSEMKMSESRGGSLREARHITQFQSCPGSLGIVTAVNISQISVCSKYGP